MRFSSLSDSSDSLVQKAANNARVLSAAMVQRAKSGHPGGAMGAAEAITLLYAEFLRYNPGDPHWCARDRFFMDPGHMSPLLYSELLFTGRLQSQDLKDFRQLGSRTSGHPELDVALGIENTSGPLGLGHGLALGCAIAERMVAARFGEQFAHKTVCLISDGTVQEEIAYGVGRIAGHLKLSNFICFYDSNGVQLSSPVSDVMSHSVKAQYEAWGWRVLEVDGHDISALRKAFYAAYSEKERPVLVIGNTTMGKGVKKEDGSSFEGQVSTHGQPLDAAGASTRVTIEGLGGNPVAPFEVWDETEELFEKRARELEGVFKKWSASYEAWAEANPALDREHSRWFESTAPELDLTQVQQKEGVATRVNSGAILGWLAENQKNMFCASADLSNSDNTQNFLDKAGILKPGDFSGAFLQAGVAELTMAAVSCGVALHGEMIAACATFFVFSDYMKPVMRLAALMGIPVKFIFTHDSFRVGEDGPTHEPIEHEMQLRLLENMDREDGTQGMLVLRPADAAETTYAWTLAMVNGFCPTALILSRQVMPPLPRPSTQIIAPAYVVQTDVPIGEMPAITLVANGSEVNLAIQAAKVIREKFEIDVRVVSMMSPRYFRELSDEKKELIFPQYSAVFAISSGLPQVFEGAVGRFGEYWGLSRFGASAPFNVLEIKFGFTPEAIAVRAIEYLKGFLALWKALRGRLSKEKEAQAEEQNQPDTAKENK